MFSLSCWFYSTETFSPRQSPLSGDRDETASAVESQSQRLTRILVVDIPLCGTLSVIGSGNTLNNRTVRIGNPPNLLGDDSRKAVDEFWSKDRIEHKSIRYKHLRSICPAAPHLSPYVPRVYVERFSSSTVNA